MTLERKLQRSRDVTVPCCPLHRVNFVSAIPVGIRKIGGWKRELRTDSLLLCHICLIPVEQPARDVLLERLYEISDWQERRWQEVRTRRFTFWKLFWRHNPAEDNNVHSVYLYFLWRLLVWQIGFTAVKCSADDSMLWIVFVVDWECENETCILPTFFFFTSHFSHLTHFVIYLTISSSSFVFLFQSGPKTWKIDWLSCGGGMSPQEATQPASWTKLWSQSSKWPLPDSMCSWAWVGDGFVDLATAGGDPVVANREMGVSM